MNATDIGAEAAVHVIEYDAYGNPVNTGYGCDTGLQIGTASCNGGGLYGYGTATLSTAGMSVHAQSSGFVESDALASVHDVLYLNGNIPSNAHVIFSAYGSGGLSGDANASLGLSVSFPHSLIDNGTVVSGFGSTTTTHSCIHPS